jgi:hypothetical protein
VTAQLPGSAARASATDPITLGEAAAPPVAVAPVVQEPVAPRPVVTPQPVATQKPVAAQQPVVVAPRTQAPRPLVAAAPAANPAPASSGGSFKNCSDARAAGAAPLYRGDAGYRSALDRDGDGVACEN